MGVQQRQNISYAYFDGCDFGQGRKDETDDDDDDDESTAAAGGAGADGGVDDDAGVCKDTRPKSIISIVVNIAAIFSATSVSPTNPILLLRFFFFFLLFLVVVSCTNVVPLL